MTNFTLSNIAESGAVVSNGRMEGQKEKIGMG